MNPAMLALILQLVEEAVVLTPGIVEDLKTIFSKPNPTPEDWAALRTKVLAKSYADYVPASALPADNVSALPVASETSEPAPALPEPVQEAPSAVKPPSEPPVATETVQAAAEPSPYLPDGSPNPQYKHPA